MKKNVGIAIRFILLAPILLMLTSCQGSFSSTGERQQVVQYYGANLTDMDAATGLLNGRPTGKGPWPQITKSTCFLAVIAAIVNYENRIHHKPMYVSQDSQGPASGDPGEEHAGQILYDLDHFAKPDGGPLPVQGSGENRRPYTLANISYDFGGDPRSQAAGIDLKVPTGGDLYHQYIYHTGPEAATLAIAKALAQYREPVDVLVNHGEHSVILAGVWATGDPSKDPTAKILSLAVYNPWNGNWGSYLSSNNYVQVPYQDWINKTDLSSPWGGVNSWFARPYDGNPNSKGVLLDPDPVIGPYSTSTKNSVRHWIGNYVAVQPDRNLTSKADVAFDENGRAMTEP